MSKIKVDALESIYGYGDSIGPSFALVSAPKEGRKQLFRFVSCKAKVHDIVTSYVNGSGNDDWGLYDKSKMPDVDMNKLRLLVRVLPDRKDNLFAAKRTLNVIEKAAGWKPSKIVTVDMKKGKAWLITGPKQWMSAPSMLSMVTLIIRACVNNGPIPSNNEHDIENTFESWASGGGEDSRYLDTCWDKLFLIARNYDRLFKGITASICYEFSHHGDGIEHLCYCKSECATLNKRMKKLLKENNIKIPTDIQVHAF